MENKKPTFTEEDIIACWPYHTAYLTDILNGTYTLDDAKEDLNSLIGSQWDPRVTQK